MFHRRFLPFLHAWIGTQAAAFAIAVAGPLVRRVRLGRRLLGGAYGVLIAGLGILIERELRGVDVPGANDNASGVAAVATLAGELQADPLASTRVVCLFTGCEEAGVLGADAFVRELEASEEDWRSWLFINFDGVAAPATLRFLRQEGVLSKWPADAHLVRLAHESRSAARAGLGGHQPQRGAHLRHDSGVGPARTRDHAQRPGRDDSQLPLARGHGGEPGPGDAGPRDRGRSRDARSDRPRRGGLGGADAKRSSRRLMLGGEPLVHAGTVVQVVRSTGGEADRTPFALADGLGLDPVLAEGGEVDHQIGRVEQPLPYVNELSHGREGMDGVGRNPVICRGSCSGRAGGHVADHTDPRIPTDRKLLPIIEKAIADAGDKELTLSTCRRPISASAGRRESWIDHGSPADRGDLLHDDQARARLAAAPPEAVRRRQRGGELGHGGLAYAVEAALG